MQKFIFSDENIQFIKDNWETMSVTKIAKHIGCSWTTLNKEAISLGLEANPSNHWSDEDVSKLKELTKTIFICEEIANQLNRTANAVYIKARKLDIVLYLDGRKWTDEDKELLKEKWGSMKIETLALKLHRSVEALKIKANKMHLGAMIQNNEKVLLLSEISKIFSVKYDLITDKWKKYGLKIKKIYVSKKSFI